MHRRNRGVFVALLLCGFLVALTGVTATAGEIKGSANEPKDAIAGGIDEVFGPLPMFEATGYCESDCCWAYCSGEGCSVSCSSSSCHAQSGGSSSTYICDVDDPGPN
jgi:hypothetical protein